MHLFLPTLRTASHNKHRIAKRTAAPIHRHISDIQPTPRPTKQRMPAQPTPAMTMLELPPPAYTPTTERTIAYPPRTHDMHPALFRNAAGLREPEFVDVELGGAGYRARRPAPARNTSVCARLMLIFLAILGMVAVGMTVFRHHPAGAVK